MDVPTLKADKRATVGTKVTRRLREAGALPGVIYGHGESPENFSVSLHEFQIHLGHGARVVVLDLDGKKSDYLIKEVQYDHLGKDPIHVDFTRVDLTEKLKLSVAVELRGIPAGIAEGGILEQLADSIEVECIASQIPRTLHPSVAHLGVGDVLTIKDIELPEGVTAIQDGDDKIAMVRLLATKAADEDGDEEGDQSNEPEVIGRTAEGEKDESSD
jgi:large subunit ribosomal protein L25